MNILHVEDSPDDASLIKYALDEYGLNCSIERVETREEFTQSLICKDFDVILSDCSLPHFSGSEALKICQSLKPSIPFVFVSGTIGEEAAIASLREGATDYVLKDRLSRLVPALRRALLEAEEKKNQELLAQTRRNARRLEAVGTLADGMAKDFSVLLDIILGQTTLLNEVVSSSRLQGIAKIIEETAQRGMTLVQKLSAFARRSEGHFSLVDLNERVRFGVEQQKKSLSGEIHWELNLAEDLPKTYGDPHMVDRLLGNLLTNAHEAMPQGGRISISTSVVNPLAPLRDGAKNDGTGYLRLEIKDTGMGMDEETLQHVFDPFFSTKPLGYGVGLGLPEVYGLMKSHQGFTDIQSTQGQGTTVCLYFPGVEKARLRPNFHPSMVSGNLTGSESILVVEGDRAMSHFLARLLKTYGYHPFCAENPVEAQRLLEEHSEEIKVVISEMCLPEVDGFALCENLCRLKPELKVIIVGGDSDGKIQERINQSGIHAFLPKPYQGREILSCLRTILDAES